MFERQRLPDLMVSPRERFWWRWLEVIITLAILVPILGWMAYDAPADDTDPVYVDLPITDQNPACPPGFHPDPVFRGDDTYRCYALEDNQQ